jgi:hypothetical protein
MSPKIQKGGPATRKTHQSLIYSFSMSHVSIRQHLLWIAIVIVSAPVFYLLFILIIPAWRDGAFSLSFSQKQQRPQDSIVCQPEAHALIELLQIAQETVVLCSVQEYTLSDRLSTATFVSLVTQIGEKQIPVSRVYYHDQWYPIRDVQPYHKLFICESILYDKPNGSSYQLFLLPGEQGFGWQWQLSNYRYQYTGTGTGDPHKQSACTMDGMAEYPYESALDTSQLTYTFDRELCQTNGGTSCAGIEAAITNDIDVCSELTDTTQQGICRSMVAIFNDQPERCANLSSENAADLCVTHIAIRQWDRALCAQVQGDTLRTECQTIVTNDQ